MKTIIIDKETKQIIELRNYNNFSYGPILGHEEEFPFIFDDNLDISKPKYFVDQQITFQPPLPV